MTIYPIQLFNGKAGLAGDHLVCTPAYKGRGTGFEVESHVNTGSDI